MGARLGTSDDSETLRSSIREFLGKVKLAQAEVRRQIDALIDETAAQQGRRHLAKMTQAFDRIEEDLVRRLQLPIAAYAPGGASRASDGGVSGGNGRFVPGEDAGTGGGWRKGEGEYMSRQQQEQMLESRLRVVGEEELDLAIMQERNVHINRVAENVQTLNELFKDMANLVHQQQSAVDAIETNVESASTRTQAGIEHLEKAIEHQKACVVS